MMGIFSFLSRKNRKKKKSKNSTDTNLGTATKSSQAKKGKKKRKKKKDNDDSSNLPNSSSSNNPGTTTLTLYLDSLGRENSNQNRRESSDSSDFESKKDTRRKPKRRKPLDSSEQNSNNQTSSNKNFSQIDPVEAKNISKVVSWSSDNAATLMSARAQEKGEPKSNLESQNEANAIIWFNTLFKQNNDNNIIKDETQDQILKDQQDYLKRHFLAMASLGIQGGNQNNKSTYKDLEEFTNKNGSKVNLATVSSGGGRFNYRSDDGSGTDFNNFLLYDEENPLDPQLQPLQRNKERFPKSYNTSSPKTYLGAFERVSTHNEIFYPLTNTIKEASNKTGKPAIGFDIPIGGVGQKLSNNKGKKVTTGYQGRTSDGEYQTGTVLQRHAEQGNLTSTLVAFEGSGPGKNNIYGGSHGTLATIGKVAKITKSTHTLTGQGKRSTWGLKHKDDKKKAKNQTIGGITNNGGLKADITDVKLNILKQQWKTVKEMDSEEQEDFYKRLLLTKTQQERTDLFNRFRIPTTIAAPQPSAASTTTSNPTSSQSSSDSQPSIPAPPVINDEETAL